MPIHTTAFTSRHKLENPGEKDSPTVEALPYERVLKYNPNHDKQTGRFASSGGGRRGGTVGSPTHDAFGRAFGRPRRSAEAAAFGGGASLPTQRAAATAETYRKMRAGEGGLGYTVRSASPFARGGPQVIDPRFHKGPTTSVIDPRFHRGVTAEQAAARALSGFTSRSALGTPTATEAHIRRQSHPSFQTKSGHKHILNPAKTTFRV